MFLLIFEDGTILKTEIISEDDKNSCDAGCLSIIDTTTLKEYYDDQWTDIDSLPK